MHIYTVIFMCKYVRHKTYILTRTLYTWKQPSNRINAPPQAGKSTANAQPGQHTTTTTSAAATALRQRIFSISTQQQQTGIGGRGGVS